MSENDERISELEAKRDSLRIDLRETETELKVLYRERAARRYGITIGMEVISRGKHYRVDSIDDFMIHDARKPWLIGVPKKKNGEFGTRKINLYANWEKVA